MQTPQLLEQVSFLQEMKYCNEFRCFSPTLSQMNPENDLVSCLKKDQVSCLKSSWITYSDESHAVDWDRMFKLDRQFLCNLKLGHMRKHQSSHGFI